MASKAWTHLRNVNLFADCTDDDLAKIDSLLTQISVRPGEVLTKEGSSGFSFMIITDGFALVTRHGEEIGRLRPGSFVGEMALIEQAIRSATVTAITPMTVYVLNFGEFRDLMRWVPSVAAKVEAAAAARHAQNEEGDAAVSAETRSGAARGL